jgi:hypothetical protein
MVVWPKKRVFLSFRVEDKQQVQGLRLMAANDKFDIEFFDESVRTPIESTNQEYVRRKIREKINRTTVTVCMISPDTHTSAWVEWELLESFDKGNTVIAMALKGVDSAVLPRPIKERNLTFHAWDADHLAKLIDEAP